MNQLIIFDMGGVVCSGVFELTHILRDAGFAGDPLPMYRDEIMDRYSRGLMNEEEFWIGFNRKFGTDIKSPSWGPRFRPEVDQKMRPLIEGLKDTHRVVCGTNVIEPHYEIHMKNGDYRMFHRVYASHLLQIAKPDPRFWQLIMETEGYTPDRTVFIDDFIENVHAAEKLGIRCYHFKDAESFMKEFLPVLSS